MNYVRNYYDYIAYVKTLNRQKLAKIHPNYAYYEKHHICPKCLGGLENSENLVLLTGREHFLAHYLLTKIHPEEVKLHLAFWAMRNKGKGQDRYTRSSRLYEKSKIIVAGESRKRLSKLTKGIPKSEEHKKKLKIVAHTRCTKEVRQKMRDKKLGRKLSLESISKRTESRKRNMESSTCYGVKNHLWVTNGEKDKLVTESVATSYIEKGWTHGRSKSQGVANVSSCPG